MKKTALLFLRNTLPVLVATFAVTAHAHAALAIVPEIDPSLATGGLVLLGGVVLMVRSRRR